MKKLVFVIALITLFSCKSKAPKTIVSTNDKTKTETLEKKEQLILLMML